MGFSFSSSELFESCKHRYDLRYNQKLQTIETDDPSSPLTLGTALHKGIETDVETAIQEYFLSYPIITDDHITESIKLKHWIPIVKELLPEGHHEVELKDENFHGFLDLICPCTKLDDELEHGQYDLYDFKYSNNIAHYMESRQLHVYKYKFERITGKKIRKMFFVFVPKVSIKQKKTEDLQQFRQRVIEEMKGLKVQIKEVPYDPQKVADYFETCLNITTETEFAKNESFLCRFCEYQDYCLKGIDFMNLPSSERRQVGQTTKRKLWIYGSAFSGKTTFIDSASNPLNLNTDGNIQFVTMPYLAIKDTYEGRQKVLAWANFKSVIEQLEKGDNDFKTIVVDLLEDTYESCRLYMYDQMGITHESDDSFRAWDKVRTEFLSTIRRLMNLDYENIVLISHEDTSKDITKKGGDKITAIKPNIAEKVANKIAGMVDIVARVVVEDDGVRTLNFKSNEVIFGGGRLKGITTTQIPLNWDSLCKVYDEANSGTQAQETPKATNSIPTTESGQEGANSKPERASRRSTRTVRQGDITKNDDAEVVENPANVVEDDEAFFHTTSNDNFIKLHKGDVIPEDAEPITESEFGEGLKKIAQANMPTTGRTRRTRKERS